MEAIGQTTEEKLLTLLTLRHAGIAPRELLRLFTPETSFLPLDLPPLLAGYSRELSAYRQEAEGELAACREAGIELIPFFDTTYPKGLEDLKQARPLLLYLRGDRANLTRSPRLAIIGTRQPSPLGYAEAYRIAREEAERGAVVLSGLARGCDEAAHRGALDGGGKSIAVVATGLDSVHPVGHERLQQSLLDQGGLVISEYPPGTPLEPYRLVQRNRLQAALAESLLVIECGMKSGTMHTVGFAERMHRPVYALPAQGLPSQLGNDSLLRTGRAALYQDGLDVRYR